MAQYRLGTVSVTNGSTAVTGVGSFWVGNVIATNLFEIQGEGVWYSISSITDNGDLVLGAPYTGTTKTGVAYAIQRDFTPVNAYPTPTYGDVDTSSLIRQTFLDIEAALVALSPLSAILNGSISINGSLIISGTSITLPTSTVAGLPAPALGLLAYATNARVFNGAGTQEGSGAGTGGMVTSTATAWHLAGTNTVAIA